MAAGWMFIQHLVMQAESALQRIEETTEEDSFGWWLRCVGQILNKSDRKASLIFQDDTLTDRDYAM